MLFYIRSYKTIKKGVKLIDYRKSIQESLDYIEDNLKTPITATELCEQAGYSLFHYYRLFQSAVGMSVMQYILRRRLIHAIYEIRCGGKRIDVILEYGFDTYAGFYKAFRREFDCTPSTYIKKGRAKRPYKLNLYKEDYMVSHKKALDVLKHWKLENESISDVYHESNGEKSNRAFYVGKNFVLKFSKNYDEVKNAIALCNAIKGAGVCISSPIETTDGRAYVQDGELFFYVTRRISGTQMIAHDFYEGDYAAKARFVGEIIGQLHLILCQAKTSVNDVNLYESVKNWALPKSKDILSLSESFCRGYLNEFGKLYDKLPKQIIHRDPNPSNIIVSQNEWGFIDFELSEKNLRIYDPCYAAVAILSESFDEKDQAKLSNWLEIYRNILWGYDSVVKLTNEECVALPYVVMADQLVSTAWFSEQNKYTELFETNKRMTQWLITIFDELKFD